jgi:hypothetical protein
MAQPLDPKIFEPAGSAFPVAEGVASARAALAYFSSSENGTLAYLNGGQAAAPPNSDGSTAPESRRMR